MKLKHFQQKGTGDYDSLQQGLDQGNAGSIIQQVKQYTEQELLKEQQLS